VGVLVIGQYFSLCTGISDFNFIFVIFVQTICPPPSGVKLSTKRGLPLRAKPALPTRSATPR
jgi:hypothetical protein